MALTAVDAAPQSVGKYRVLAELGHGGMARVYLAVAHGPSGFSKLVVLKMLRVHLAEDPDTIAMFLDEARLAGRLNHPNVVHTYEVGEQEGHYMLVMEYLEGQPLSAVLRRARDKNVRLPLGLQLRVLIEALSGLHYAHELRDFDGTPLNLVHRDVSPQNIFITYDGQIKVLDFGIAKAITSSAETKAGVIKGKIAYMAPEQFLGEKVDRRVDVYGMGAVVWQLASGQRLWKGVPDGQVIHRVVNGDLPSPRDVNPEADEELTRICMKALAKDRTERYASALEMQQDLEAMLDNAGQRCTARDVGVFVADMFEDLRSEITRTIETQLSKARALNSGEPTSSPMLLPSLDTYSRMLTRQEESSPSGKLHPSSADSARVSLSNSQLRAVANSIAAGPSRPAVSRGTLLAVAAGLLVCVGLLMYFVPMLRAGSDTATTFAPASVHVPAATAPASVEAAPSAAPAEQFVEFQLQATPAEAKLYFDDAPLPTNPATRKLRKDGSVHTVRAEAHGFESRSIEVVADKDAAVAIALERVIVKVGGHRVPPKAPPPPATTAATPPSTPPVPSAPPAEDTTKSARDRINSIDKSNPWK